jgi:hypothetical protein
VFSPLGAATGATRWYWQLREPGYVPFVTLLYRARLAGGRPADSAFRDVWQSAGVRYVVRTPEFDADLARAGGEIEGYVTAVIRECGRPLLHLDDATYGPVDVLALPAVCTPVSGR